MKQIRFINVPALKETAEGQLKGGFTFLGGDQDQDQGGINHDCGNNEVCFDNNVCYGNAPHCQGNYPECGTNTPSSTGTATGTSNSHSSSLMGDILFSF